MGLEKPGATSRGARHAPCFIYISKTDEENSDYNATFDAPWRERFRQQNRPIVVPIWDDNKKVTGIIDVLNKRAYEMQNGKRVEIELPEGKEDVVTQFNDALKESVAETSEEFMDKFFLRRGLHLCGDDPGLCQGVGSSSFSSVLWFRRVHPWAPDADGQYRGASAQPGGGQHAQGHAPQRRQVRNTPSPAAYQRLRVQTVSDQYGKYLHQGHLPAPSPRPGPGQRPHRLPLRSWAGCTTMRGKKAVEVKELLWRYRRHRQAGEGQDR